MVIRQIFLLQDDDDDDDVSIGSKIEVSKAQQEEFKKGNARCSG